MLAAQYLKTHQPKSFLTSGAFGTMGFCLPCAMNDFIAAEGPCFLDVVTDQDEMVYPKVPLGKGYRDMVLGPHISWQEV